MEDKLKHGGKREGAGRKPVPVSQKKVALTIYPSNADLYKFGSTEKMKTELLKFISGYGKPEALQDLTRRTNEIKPFEQPKSNYEVKIDPKPISTVMSNFETLKAEILATTIIPELEKIMKKVKAALLPLPQKVLLENIAKDHSKTMYND